MPSIPLKDFVKEHKHLLKVLTKGTATQRKKEAKAQAMELRLVLQKLPKVVK